jgi:hypothetical protein
VDKRIIRRTVGQLSQFCTGVCKDKISTCEDEEPPLLETVAREQLVKTQQAGKA